MCDSNGSPSRTFLDSVTARFEQQFLERQKKLEKKKCQREVELAHSQYLKQNVVDSQEMARAKFVVGTWSRKHGDVEKKWITKDKREKQRIEDRFSPYGKISNSRKKPFSPVLQKNRAGTVLGNKQETLVPSANTAVPVNSLDDPAEEVVMIGNDELLVCPVLYCEVRFTSRDQLQQHMEDFDHSPINPCLENPNGALTVTQEYVCTNCRACFRSRKNWEHHQRMEGPSSSSVEGFCSSPKLLAVAGYLCPKTLSVFSSFESCEASIQKGTTGIIKFPFKDDLESQQSIKPCPVSKTFIDDFTTRCKSCPYSISCIDCEVEISDNASLQDHVSVTDQSHILTARSNLSKEEVFSEYLTEHISNFTEILSKYENVDSKIERDKQEMETFSNFVNVLCRLLE
ncbi:uncharacterized protein LOC125671539 isoform X2 [Ostrea edulis]|uniref:uncharacterized protein LOC125671539 isoform X2 n=1 Tax=Ostrea edulis TaxID=37623 RepID=UPI002094583A|nr:uncharacterized protein LOC125671539 isoform X2 [Ostrea edulis]